MSNYETPDDITFERSYYQHSFTNSVISEFNTDKFTVLRLVYIITWKYVHISFYVVNMVY